MKKNIVKKTLLVMALSGLVLTMTACKDKDTNTSDPSTQEAVENTTEQEDNASTEQAESRTTESRSRKDNTEDAAEGTTEVAKNTSSSGSRPAQANTTSNPGRTSAAGQSSTSQTDNTPIGDASQAFDNTNTTPPPANSTAADTDTSTESNNTSNNTTPAQHTHTWVAVTETVNHPEEGHYEKVEIAPAFTQPKYESHTICHVCGFDYTANQTKPGQHTCPGTDTFGTYGSMQVQVGTITTPAIYEDQWVIDKSAWTETVTTGYKCSTCGETKSN